MQRSSILVTTLLALGIHAASAAPGAHGPDGQHLDGPTSTAAPTGLARLPDGSVNVPKRAQRRLGIRTQLSPLAEAAATVELNGRVAIDPNAGGQVQPVHDGRIEAGPNGLPVAGQIVRKGELLALLSHHAEPFEQANQSARWRALRTERELAELRLARLQALRGSVPRKEIDAAQAELASLREREQRIGASLDKRERLEAPVDGVIASARALQGQVVKSGDVLFEIVDPHRLLIEAYSADPTLAAQIDSATLAGVDATSLQLIGSALRLQRGLLPLTFRLQTPADAAPPALVVGQPVTVIAQLKQRVSGIVLPAQSIVRNSANEAVVWIKIGAERYLPQPVQYQPLDAQTVLITAGLAADNRVVVEGAALINQIR